MAIKVTVFSRSPNRVSLNAPNQATVRTIKQGQASLLSQLTDIDLTNLADGHTLIYNAITGKFEAGIIAELDGGTF